MIGTIVLYKSDGSYGFIRSERPVDTFFHVSEFRGDPKLLVVGAEVEFDLGERKGRIVARDVRLLEPASKVGQ